MDFTIEKQTASIEEKPW